MTIEPFILSFRQYAQTIFDEQRAYLNKYSKNHLLNGKLIRLKFFNTHLEVLKNQLKERIEIILKKNVLLLDYELLEKTLRSISAEYINEYMSIPFLKG